MSLNQPKSRAAAVVSISGGMDSCVLTAMAARDARDRGGAEALAALHVNYGQRTEKRELAAYAAVCDFYRIDRRLVVDLPFFRQIGASSLTDPSIPVPDGAAAGQGIPTTYVPFRNGVILSVAAAWAEALGAQWIYLGAVQTDRPGYPDCRREFLESMSASINLGTRPETHLSLRIPLVGLDKSDIVRTGMQLGAPFHLTWSCYRRESLACGRCASCRLRLKAFADAGERDPVSYE